MMQQLAAQGIVHAEVYISVGVIYMWRNFDPRCFEPIFAALERARERAARELGLSLYWIFDAVRHFTVEEADRVFRKAAEMRENNTWLVETIARAATDNHWPRVDVKAGNVAPGVNGGHQARVRSPMNKGRGYNLPGIGLAGDWPGGWTQTYAQMNTEAGPGGFDRDYFRAQVAGLTQVAGDLMRVDPKVIDLGWGELKSAIANLDDKAFLKPDSAKTQRQALLARCLSAFRIVESGDRNGAQAALKTLSTGLPAAITPDARDKVSLLIGKQLGKIG